MNADKTELFETRAVPSAVLTLVIPTVISQLITVVYNLADTYFIGQINDPSLVAAVVVATPAFIFLTGIANLFGLGGASLISRCLGVGDTARAERTAAFAVWGGGLTALLYGLLFAVLRPQALSLLGATAETFDAAYRYIFWTTTLGALPTVMNSLLAHLVRAEGAARQAGFGVALGGLLNIALDPLLMFPLGMGLTGAAVATMISNCLAVVYFLIYLYRHRGSTVVRPRPSAEMLRQGIPREVLSVGLPNFITSVMVVVSNATLTHLISRYATAAVAGLGIAKKIDSMAFAVSRGLSQGVLPLIGYNFSAGNQRRVRQSVRFTLLFGLAVTGAITACVYLFAPQITRFFIADGDTVAYGKQFLRIVCFFCPSSCINFLIVTIFQATGKTLQPLLLSLLRRGGLDVPLMFLLEKLMGMPGIAWATPISDWTAVLVAAAMVIPYMRKLNKRAPPAA